MKVLIVQSAPGLAELWAAALRRAGLAVEIRNSEAGAIAWLAENEAAVIVLDLALEQGSALAVADYASYRHPAVQVIPVTRASFFSDGSAFAHIPNACAQVGDETRPEDLTAIVAHYGRRAGRGGAPG